MLLHLNYFSPQGLVAETVIIDESAPIEKQAQLTTAANGVPVINIAAPNATGISHNLFQKFNVERRGLVVNNEVRLGTSQLAGALLGNPNLKGQAARVILNEVSSVLPTRLHGYTEVFGAKATLIIANPNGIHCNGCGFINVPRAVLTTGRSRWDNANLKGFTVKNGNIEITGDGLNASNTEYLDILSRSATIHAKLHAKKLRFFLGPNEFNYANNNLIQSETESEAPLWALDAAALGGMYAHQIYIVATENGVGVNMQSDVVINANNLEINAAGDIVLHSHISSKENITLHSQEKLEMQNQIYGGNNIRIKAKTIALTSTAKLLAAQDIQLGRKLS